MSGNRVTKNIIISFVAVSVIAATYHLFKNNEGGAYLPLLLVSFVAVLISTFVASAGSIGLDGEGYGGLSGQVNGADEEEDIDDGREVGTVKWFNVAKGFGFITRSTGDDVFVHFRNIRGRGHRSLNEGQRVRFTVHQSDKGLQAEDVSIIRE